MNRQLASPGFNAPFALLVLLIQRIRSFYSQVHVGHGAQSPSLPPRDVLRRWSIDTALETLHTLNAFGKWTGSLSVGDLSASRTRLRSDAAAKQEHTAHLSQKSCKVTSNGQRSYLRSRPFAASC